MNVDLTKSYTTDNNKMITDALCVMKIEKIEITYSPILTLKQQNLL